MVATIRPKNPELPRFLESSENETLATNRWLTVG